MQLDMRPDSVLITCEALRLRHVQATQASSSHIVIGLASILRVPSCTLSNSDIDFHRVFAGDNEMALGARHACAGKHRPHTYAE